MPPFEIYMHQKSKNMHHFWKNMHVNPKSMNHFPKYMHVK